MLDYGKPHKEVFVNLLVDANTLTISDASAIILSKAVSLEDVDNPALSKIRVTENSDNTAVIEYERISVVEALGFLNEGNSLGCTGSTVHEVMTTLMKRYNIFGDATEEFVDGPITVDGDNITFTLEATPGSIWYYGSMAVVVSLPQLSNIIPDGRTIMWN